jgi:hypothetical protein
MKDVFRDHAFADIFESAHGVKRDDYKLLKNKANQILNRMIVDMEHMKYGTEKHKDHSILININNRRDYFDLSSSGGVEARIGRLTTARSTLQAQMGSRLSSKVVNTFSVCRMKQTSPTGSSRNIRKRLANLKRS